MSKTKYAPALAIDFDGVIHTYSQGWKDGSCYDAPVLGSYGAIKAFQEAGYAVFILSTRNPKQIAEYIAQHFPIETEIIPDDVQFWNNTDILGITNRKLPAVAYIDDRAVEFRGNWKEMHVRVFTHRTYQEEEAGKETGFVAYTKDRAVLSWFTMEAGQPVQYYWSGTMNVWRPWANPSAAEILKAYENRLSKEQAHEWHEISRKNSEKYSGL